MKTLFARYRLSLWLIVASLILAASQMHPGFATLLVLAVIALLLLGARLVAHLEASTPDTVLQALIEALKQIANGDGYYGAQAREYKEIARAAIARVERH
jgi:hypothetical protein